MKSILKKIIVSVITFEAKLALKKYKPKIIAVTGNVGKTSTKDAIYTALSGPLSIRKNQKSFNSEIGVPLTILGLENAWGNPLKWFQNIFQGALVCAWPQKYPKWLVLEIGADHPGDIKNLTKWLTPDIVVFTRIPHLPVHIEYFKDAESLAEEKAYLLKALKPDGIAILNADDERICALGKYAKGEVIYFGMDKPATIHGSDYSMFYENDLLKGIQFRIFYDSNVLPIVLRGVVGLPHVYPVLAALAVSLALKLPLVKCAESFTAHEYPHGRLNLIEGIKDTTIIDDTYNSSPVALEYALKTLGEAVTSGRKIAVLGDMLELGSFSVDAHKDIGKIIPKNSDVLFTVGVRARDFGESAIEAGMNKNMIGSFTNSEESGNFLKDFIKKGDVILAKGSQGMRMEKVLEPIILDKENIKNLLVRQEKEWLAKN